MSATLAAVAPAGALCPLRQVDWRFLLPRPAGERFGHLLLLGGSAAMAARVRDLALADRTSLSLAAGRTADAIVALRGARAPLPAIVGALEPGGALYLEVDRRVRGRRSWSPRRVRRSLARLGVAVGPVFAVWPSLARPRVCLPLSTPRPLRWFVETSFMANSPWRRAAEAALRALTRLDGRRVQPLLPQYVIVARAAGAPAGAPAVCACLSDDEPPADPALVFGGNRVVVLPFPRGGGAPRAAYKVPKLPEFNDRADTERSEIRRLRARVRAGIPEPVDVAGAGPTRVTALRYVDAVLMQRTSSRWGAPAADKLADLRLAAGWLAEFHRDAAVRRAPFDAAGYDALVGEPLDAYQTAFGVSVREARLFDRVRSRAAALAGVELPTVRVHRDYNVWNIARTGPGIVVFDWEGARDGPPLCDLLHFTTHWLEHVRHSRTGADRRRDFRELHLAETPRHWAARAARAALADYRAAIGLDGRWEPLLLVYLWVEMALRRLAQRRAEGELTGGTRTDNGNLERIAALAASADALFQHDA